ncbi:MAG TPA: DUF3987 domain-containing protein [Gammaproteobacteria bacterium]|nr:DUF3987 domain-containing protein [Gammaproteobacteria bacterium]
MNDTQHEHLRQPPASIEAEQAVLGSLMIAPEALTALQLSDTDFYWRTNADIFRAIREHAEQGKPFDAVTIGEWFESQGRGNEVRAGSDLVEFAQWAIPSSIETHAAIIRDHALKRSLIELGTDVVNHGFNGAAPADTISEAMSGLARLSSLASSETADPIDLFGDHDLPELKREWLPQQIARYAWDQAEIIGMAPEMMAMSCLVAAAAATHDRIVIKPKGNEGWTERACLWLMVIAPPSSTKSKAISLPLKPLKKIEAEISGDYDRKIAEYIKANEIRKAREKASIRREAKGEGGLDPDEPMPDRPPNLRAIVNDVTSEKLIDLLVDNDRGLLMNCDEIALWFGRHDSYRAGGMGGTDRALALQAYDGGTFTQDRMGRGTVRVPNLSYSLVGTTQPKKIKETVSKMSDDGLLQRFMVMEVATKALYGDEDRPEDVQARNDYERIIRNIWSRAPAEGQQLVVTLSPEADAIRREFHRWVVKVSSTEGLPDMLRSNIGKWKALWPRLALAYHSFGTASASLWPSDHQVSALTAQRVTSLLQRFLLPHAMRFYTDTVASADPVYSLAKRIAAIILSTGDLRLTKKKLQQNMKAWTTAADWQKQATITLLRESGWLTGVDSKRVTGSDTGWSVNPRVHALFAERARIEVARRAETAEALRELRDAAAGR